jgi:hypothetical protein
VLPTRFGLFVATLLAAMLLGALNYNNNPALLLALLLAAARSPAPSPRTCGCPAYRSMRSPPNRFRRAPCACAWTCRCVIRARATAAPAAG